MKKILIFYTIHQINHSNITQKNWVIINDDASGSYNANSHVIIIM